MDQVTVTYERFRKVQYRRACNAVQQVYASENMEHGCWYWRWAHPRHRYSLSPHDSYSNFIHIYPTYSALLYYYYC